jgi:rhodanese-related sulfurtransferase
VVPTPTGYTLYESLEIKPADFNGLLNRKNITVIDVRESDHRLSPADFQHVHIPFSELPANLEAISGDTIITFCEQGILSLHAARMLRDTFGTEKKIYSLQKGINYWNSTHRETGT